MFRHTVEKRYPYVVVIPPWREIPTFVGLLSTESENDTPTTFH